MAQNQWSGAQNQWSGLRDRNGKRIHCRDRLRFFYRDGCIWDGTVTFEDGVYTVSIQNATQIANPRTWEHMFNWVASRNWACLVGYGEMGTWNVPRAPLTKIVEGWATYEDVKVLYEKYGYTDGRILQVEVRSDGKSR